MDVVVVAPLDAKRRGRPRVGRDVAAVLASTPLAIEAAFVGPLEHCAGQERVPGDVLNDMMSSLHLHDSQVGPALPLRLLSTSLCCLPNPGSLGSG